MLFNYIHSDTADLGEHVHAVLPGVFEFHGGVPFDASLFVDLRKRIGQDLLNAINERIVTLHRQAVERQAGEGDDDISDDGGLYPPMNYMFDY